jgi:Protein of unknown function (DUF3225)
MWRVQIDDPNVIAEVTQAFLRYEAALVAERHDELDSWFWTGEQVVRFGVAEVQYGPDAISSWRRRSPHVGDDRTLQHTVVTAFGADHAVVVTEFVRPGASSLGRQSQVWVRMEDGWRIAHAHVSMVDAATVERRGPAAG